MNKGEVKPLTSGERASISKFHIFVTKTMLVFSTNYLLEEYFSLGTFLSRDGAYPLLAAFLLRWTEPY